MNRRQLHDGIYELADDTHMLAYALGAALAMLDAEAVGKVFDQVADHHELRAGRPSSAGRGHINVVAVPPGEKYVPADPHEIVLDLRD